MKKIYLLIASLILIVTNLDAQENKKVQKLIATGDSVFIEVVDIKKNTDGAYDSFKRHLLGEEWNRWVLVDSVSQANFICRLNIEKKGFTLSFKSDGARIRVITEILAATGESVWKSKRIQGNATMFTEWDALSDAMRKVIRRSLTEELYLEKRNDTE